MKNKISIFGSSGFIGSRFCDMHKDCVIKIGRNDYEPQSSELLYFISTIDNYNIHNDLHIDVNTNLNVLMSVLERVDRQDPNLVINFVSSWFVYGKNAVMPFHEDSSYCNPTGFYSITKRCAEQLLISFCETFNIKYRIFRLANVLGEGDLKISRKKNALQYLIKQAVNNEELLLYNGGNVVRDYVYIDDVCNAIKHCIDHAPVNEIINIGSGKPYTLVDIINRAISEAKVAPKITNIVPPHFHKVVQVEHSYLDISKLTSYGFESQYSIDAAIAKLVSFYKNKKND